MKHNSKTLEYLCYLCIAFVLFFGAIGAMPVATGLFIIFLLGVTAGSANGYHKVTGK